MIDSKRKLVFENSEIFPKTKEKKLLNFSIRKINRIWEKIERSKFVKRRKVSFRIVCENLFHTNQWSSFKVCQYLKRSWPASIQSRISTGWIWDLFKWSHLSANFEMFLFINRVRIKKLNFIIIILQSKYRWRNRLFQ